MIVPMVVIVTVLFGMFCAAMEALITATILPTIIAQLGGMELYPWIVNSFLLSFIIVTPLFGKLSDTYGYKKVYLASVVIFCLSSILCGASQSMQQLIAFRGLQGIGTGGLITMSIIFFGEIFPLEKRPRMQALLSSMWALASLLGPTIGALLSEKLSWRWAFYINVPSAILIFLLILAFASDNKTGERHKNLDGRGLILFLICSASFVFALFGFAELKPTPLTFFFLLMSMSSAAILIWHMSRVNSSFIPVKMFRKREVVLSVTLGFFAGFFLFTIANFLPMYVQGVLGMTPKEAGWIVTAIALGSFMGAIICGIMLNRKGFRTLSVCGASAVLIGFSLLNLLDQENLAALACTNFLVGAGISAIANACIIAAQAASPRSMLGSATSLFHFFRSIGGLIGITAMGGMQLGIFQRGVKTLIESDRKFRYLSEFLHHPHQIFDPVVRSLWTEEQLGTLPKILKDSIQPVFFACFLIGLLTLFLTLKMPAKKPKDYSLAEDPVPLEE